MEAANNVIAVLAGVVGLLTALLTFYAKFVDVKKNAARGVGAPDPAPAAEPVHVRPGLGPVPARERDQLGWGDEPPPRNTTASAVVRAREAVRAPATTLLVAGLLTMVSNLFIAGFGYVDRFVTPLTTESRNQRALMESVRRGEAPPYALGVTGPDAALSDDATAVLTVCTLISLAAASGAAAWAGYGMLKLRSYWLSVAGSVAIMAGGSFCCMAGIPIGIWSLCVLFKPDVAASFR